MFRRLPPLFAVLVLSMSGTALADARPTPAVASVVAHSASGHSARQRRRERAQVRAELARRRATNLARFEAYVARGSYPVNSYEPGPLNVFIDDEGRICAAATIMTDDGLGELVRALASSNNFLRLGTVTDGPVMEWILRSGFTQEEIAMIQEPFMGNRQPEPDLGVGPRQAEHERLVARYAEILAALRHDARANLDVATSRLLAHAHAAPASAS